MPANSPSSDMPQCRSGMCEAPAVERSDYCARHSAECQRCNTLVNRVQMAHVEDDRWCTACVTSYAYYCGSCCCYTLEQHDHMFDDFDEDDDHEDRDRNNVGDHIRIESYDFNPHSWQFLTTPGEKCSEFYAVELEVAFNHQPHPGETMSEVFAGSTDVYFKHDGSIESGRCGPGVEIVTQPCSWNYLKSLRDTWSKRLAGMRQAGFRSYDTNSCGLHVHVSRAPFTATDLIRLQALIYDNGELFRHISQRNKYDYCAFDARDARDPRFRLLKAGTARHGKHYRHFDYDPHNYEDRRVALNFPQDTPTIEFRFFRGTLHEPSFWKALECVRACVTYCRETADTTEAAFLTWLYARERTYPNLTSFLSPQYGHFRPVKHPRGTHLPVPTFNNTNF